MTSPIAVRASEIASLLTAELIGADVLLSGVCSSANPKPNRLGFIKKFDGDVVGLLSKADRSVFLIPKKTVILWPGNFIPVDNPRGAFARVVETYFAAKPPARVASTAIIDPTAELGRNVSIGEFCVISAGVKIGADTELRHHVVIGPNVTIGERCLIKSNSVIGEEGFGIDRDESNLNRRVPHLGAVVIGDDVEIGALNTVCSGTIDPTVIESCVKTDDHVHIAHNCKVGRNSILTACAELSGSVVIGADVWLGPNCSVINGVTLNERVFVGIGSVVTRDCDAHGVYAGIPAKLIRERNPQGMGP